MLVAVFQMTLAGVELHLPKQWGDKLTSHPSKQERVFQSVWRAGCAVKPNRRTLTKTKPAVLPAAASMKEGAGKMAPEKKPAPQLCKQLHNKFGQNLFDCSCSIHIGGNIYPKMYLKKYDGGLFTISIYSGFF